MSDQERSDAMPMARFAAIIEAYGAAPQRWPAAERGAAQALLAASAEARALQSKAAELDRMLTAARAPQPSSALRAAILAAAPRRPGPAPAGFTESLRGLWQTLLGTLSGELGGLRPAGAVLGLALLLGIAAGGAVESQSSGTTTTVAAGENLDLIQLALFDDPYAEY